MRDDVEPADPRRGLARLQVHGLAEPALVVQLAADERHLARDENEVAADHVGDVVSGGGGRLGDLDPEGLQMGIDRSGHAGPLLDGRYRMGRVQALWATRTPACSHVLAMSETVARCTSRTNRMSSKSMPRCMVQRSSHMTRSWTRQRWV